MSDSSMTGCGHVLQDEFVFFVEGTGALDCGTIVKTALDILSTKMRELKVLLASD